MTIPELAAENLDFVETEAKKVISQGSDRYATRMPARQRETMAIAIGLKTTREKLTAKQQEIADSLATLEGKASEDRERIGASEQSIDSVDRRTLAHQKEFDKFRGQMNRDMASLFELLEELQSAVENIAQSSFVMAGEYVRSEGYLVNDVVTASGNYYLATRETMPGESPGGHGSPWRLLS